jgi:alkylhydroperoxidase/carboxymuconolactone decarboxylase family protein YurZ
MDLSADQPGGLVTPPANSTHAALASISGGREGSLTALTGTREQQISAAGLDPRTFALVKIAAMIALDAPPASYAREVGDAMQDLVTAEDLLGVLRAVAPQVGAPRVVAAAPELMLALGLSLPESTD